MKHLLTGVAIAAALAIAAPLSAQAAPMSPSGQPAATAKTHHTAAKPRPHRMVRHAARSGHMRTASRGGDEATRQLNMQELQRIEGAAPTPQPMPAPAPHH
jgi:hypothetical protein